MLNNLTGWHFVMMLGALATMAVVVAVIVAIVVVSIRRSRGTPGQDLNRPRR